MHLAKLSCQRSGRRDIAHLPAGDMVGFAETADDKSTRRQSGKTCSALVNLAQVSVKHHVLVHLVTDQQSVGGCQNFLELKHFCLGPDGRARVVRRVDDDGACSRANSGLDLVKVRTKTARGQSDSHHSSASQFNAGYVAVVAGFKHDDFIARMHHGQNDRDDCLGSASGNRDFAARVITAPIQRCQFAGHCLAQRWHTGHWRVLVVALLHGGCYRVDKLRVAVKVRKTLAEINRTFFCRQCRHDGKNSRADVGQPACQHRRAGSSVSNINSGCANHLSVSSS